MKMPNWPLAISLILSFSVNGKDLEKVVYGEDNRQDVFATSQLLFRELAKSTAAMIPSSLLEEEGDFFKLKSPTLADQGVCLDARFVHQPVAAMCSGFLVGKDLLLTAGHCVESMSDCETKFWVFDYSNSLEEKSLFMIPKKDVYHCTEIVSRVLDRKNFNDYALLKLDRMSEREPLKVRKSGKIAIGAELVVIGHPSGLPTKIADGAFVRTNDEKYFFEANLDTFGGNSGSAVFDPKTGLVEGILVRGEKDYVTDPSGNCNRPNVCTMEDCRGEDVTRITMVKKLK